MQRRARSDRYVFTFDPMSRADLDLLARARSIVAEFNKEHPRRACKLALSPRGPRREYAWKYDNKHKPRLRVEDASSVDVYVVAKSDSHRHKPRGL